MNVSIILLFLLSITVCSNVVAPDPEQMNILGNLLNMMGGQNGKEECYFICPNDGKISRNPEHVPSSNGCGAHGIKMDVSSMPGFEECCNIHDICYDTCGKDRKTCDEKFDQCLKKKCEHITTQAFTQGKRDQVKERCRQLNHILYSGASSMGCTAYQMAQSNACLCDGEKVDLKSSGTYAFDTKTHVEKKKKTKNISEEESSKSSEKESDKSSTEKDGKSSKKESDKSSKEESGKSSKKKSDKASKEESGKSSEKESVERVEGKKTSNDQVTTEKKKGKKDTTKKSKNEDINEEEKESELEDEDWMEDLEEEDLTEEKKEMKDTKKSKKVEKHPDTETKKKQKTKKTPEKKDSDKIVEKKENKKDTKKSKQLPREEL